MRGDEKGRGGGTPSGFSPCGKKFIATPLPIKFTKIRWRPPRSRLGLLSLYLVGAACAQ